MLRGDVDRFYRALKQEHPMPPAGRIARLDHVRGIASYYNGLAQEERLLLLAWAKKEESGIGIIPLALSAIPFFGLIISARLQEMMSRLPMSKVLLTWLFFASLVLTGFYIHQRQKAYTMLHIVLLEQAIKRHEARERQAQAAPANHPPAPPEATFDPQEESQAEIEAQSQAESKERPPEEDRRLTLPPAQGTH